MQHAWRLEDIITVVVLLIFGWEVYPIIGVRRVPLTKALYYSTFCYSKQM